ncbi:MAG: non-homologous end-joining DNA ligase [Acidimicrobiia bacterium]|nr:non-homologous end-joining DNA ligase [Acidimicrobiia bacterium]
MLAVPWAGPFSDPDWTFEPKMDGIRAVVTVDGTDVAVRGRRDVDITVRYPELQGLRTPGAAVVVDGEIVAIEDGVPSFERLQRRMHLGDPDAVRRAAAEVPVQFVAFDLLYRDEPLVDLPLEARRERLAELDLGSAMEIVPAIDGDGEALWESVVARGLEGMVAKRRGSRYRPGARSPDWRKVPHVRVTEAVVGGYTPGEGGRRATFGALLLGRWDGDALRYVGSVGTGFGEADGRAIRAALDEMETGVSPFHPDDGLPRGAVWVEPVLVASIGYRDTTVAGRLRHPRFRGFTDDDPASVRAGE